MPHDLKYGKVTTERGDIPDDEPVILFRGRDTFLVRLLMSYKGMCESGGSPKHHVQLVEQRLQEIATWQREHPDRLRTPTSEWFHPEQ